MIDIDGSMGTSCDCSQISSSCLHILLIEQYHSQFDESVFQGEEPDAFLVNLDYEDLQYLYSVNTISGSHRHHSHKRTIVTCNLIKDWYCRSCPRSSYSPLEKFLISRDYRYITLCRDNLLELLLDSEQISLSSTQEAVQLVVKSRPSAIIRRCISHLSILPLI